MRKNENRKYGFTLAETLLILVIVGVISIMVLPTIQSMSEKREFVNRARKGYSVLQQTTYRIAAELGYPVGDFDFIGRQDFFPIFLRQIKKIKICTEANQGCFHSGHSTALDSSTAENYDHAETVVSDDGIAYGWELAITNPTVCSNKGFYPEDIANCKGIFIVDVNGNGAPNRHGRDIFFFGAIDGKGIVPAGSGNKSADCNVGNKGFTCAAKVLRDSRMAY